MADGESKGERRGELRERARSAEVQAREIQ
jgi:hypothetical protein